MWSSTDIEARLCSNSCAGELALFDKVLCAGELALFDKVLGVLATALAGKDPPAGDAFRGSDFGRALLGDGSADSLRAVAGVFGEKSLGATTTKCLGESVLRFSCSCLISLKRRAASALNRACTPSCE
jgi:hypothetical protein